jgi:hypothetical protein
MNLAGRSIQQSECAKCMQAMPECPHPLVAILLHLLIASAALPKASISIYFKASDTAFDSIRKDSPARSNASFFIMISSCPITCFLVDLLQSGFSAFL